MDKVYLSLCDRMFKHTYIHSATPAPQHNIIFHGGVYRMRYLTVITCIVSLLKKSYVRSHSQHGDEAKKV